MSQNETDYREFVPLAIHLADDYFLSHQSRDVQLLIACCIVDVLRVFAPEAPYKKADQIKTILMFLSRQLESMKEPKDVVFKRYSCLLKNLAHIKSFSMYFKLEESQAILCNLFNLFFRKIK